MAEAPKRPWTPTERPGDASYTSPVVYHGAQQVHRDDSSVSSESESEIVRVISPTGKEVPVEDLVDRPHPLRFRSSQMFGRDSAKDATEAVGSLQGRDNRASGSGNGASHTLPSQRSSQSLSPNIDDIRLPENNPFRLSRTLGTPSPELRKASTTQPAPAQNVSEKDDRGNPYVPYRPSVERSESTEDLLIKPQRPMPNNESDSAESAPLAAVNRLSQVPRFSSSDSIPQLKPQRLSQAAQTKPTYDELPSVTGRSSRQIKILLINPNSSKSMTERCLESVSENLPVNVTVTGFTPSRPAPTAIESQTDGAMSAAACVKAVLPIASAYDGFLIACFSHHPLIAALREQLMQPVIGIMEAALYASRMCGSKVGIVATGVRSMYTLDTSVKLAYGLGPFSVGAESCGLGVLELESRPEREVTSRMAAAAKRLQARGADCICLGCAGMTDLQEVCQHAVGMHDRMAMVVDGVAMGVHFLVGLVRENLGTAKGAMYNNNTGNKAFKSQS